MTGTILLISFIILACILANKISNKIGVPVLLAFLALGMLFGTDGVLKINFENFQVAQSVCLVALIFIMFYGGFGTNWHEAKPVAAKAVVLSSAGTILTAGFVGLFCHLVLKIDLLESFLIGAVISSTDAASMFSVLRSKRLNLKNKTASILELESGSNDPFAYMLTVLILALMGNEASGFTFVWMIFAQVFFGVLCGILISVVSLKLLFKLKLSESGFDTIFIFAIALLSYAISALIGGNGYLSVYISGIILGNSRLSNKKALVHFFDGITSLMQMLLFFLLGLLSFPSLLPKVALVSLAIAVFLTLIARPLSVFLLLLPFGKNIRQYLVISWAGMRGAASIVFAIMTVTSTAVAKHDIFHIVFFIVLFSILLQGTLLPKVSKWLKMTDDKGNVLKTFNDYTEEVPVQFVSFTIPKEHMWAGKHIKEILLPPECILALIIRNGQKIVPYGSTLLNEGDTLILGGQSGNVDTDLRLVEKKIQEDDEWIDMTISQIELDDELIVLIKRNNEAIIPKGNTKIKCGDVLVITDANTK